MIPELYDHQKKIVSDDFKWFGNWQGTGSAKTRSCLELAEGSVLVICPKQQKLDRTWEINAEKFDIILNMKVMSKEEFRRDWDSILEYDTVIVDEAHDFFGVYPQTVQRKLVKYPKTSQMFESLRSYLQKHPPKRFYLATATPVSKPFNLFAIAKLFGVNWDYFKFRDKYYIEIQRGVWIPRKTKALQERLSRLTKRFGYTGSLQDFFDVPEQTHKTIYVPLTKEQMVALNTLEMEEADPLIKRGRMRTIENGVLYKNEVVQVAGKNHKILKIAELFKNNKIETILQYAEEFPKLLIFANYTAQIESIAKELRTKGYKVFELTGKSKDRGNIISTAESSERAIVVAQASVSSGYELPSFPCCIFASKHTRFLNYEQGLGRILRSNKLKKNLYIHLVVKGGSDEKCHQTILEGKDFQEKIQAQDELLTDEIDSDVAV